VTLRQAVAFTATALILHLGFVAAESRCIPEHEASEGTPASTGHHQQHSEEPPAQTIPVCCQALTSCALTVDVTSPDATFLGGSTIGRNAGAPLGSLLSRNAAPEAPPPKA
jgi:hypothetical protein